MEKANRNDQSE